MMTTVAPVLLLEPQVAAAAHKAGGHASRRHSAACTSWPKLARRCRSAAIGAGMKARVFVTLKPGVLDPQGKAIHHALEGLGFSGVNDVRAGKLIELDLADGDQRRRHRSDVPQAPRQHGDREFPDRTNGLMKTAVIVFPGSNCDRDLAVALRASDRPAAGDGLARRKRASGRHRLHRPARRLFLRRLSALGRDGGALADHARGRRCGRPRRAGARRLQRLPGADRGRPAARRADAQRGAQLRLPAGRRCGSRTASRSSPAATMPARRSASRSRTTTAIIRRTARRSTGWRATAGSRSATPRRSTARRGRSPASSTTAAMCLA